MLDGQVIERCHSGLSIRASSSGRSIWLRPTGALDNRMDMGCHH